jgi:hypothetical protein
MKQKNKKTLIFGLILAMIISLIAPLAKKEDVQAGEITFPTYVIIAPPVIGRYPEKNESGQYRVSDNSKQVKLYDTYEKNGFYHGVKWTDEKGKKSVIIQSLRQKRSIIFKWL